MIQNEIRYFEEEWVIILEGRNSKKINFVFLLAMIFLFIFIATSYKNIILKEIGVMRFSKDMVRIAEENKNPIFRINKIVLYSSADIVDNTEGDEILKNFDMQQYTDIAIYIDNRNTITDLTLENTINELYVDNIQVDINTNQENQILNYKSPLNIAKFRELSKVSENEKIDFKIYKTNDQKAQGGYDSPAFFTDCSDPISLGYINKDIIKNCALTEETGFLAFNGTILKNANVNLKSISSKIRFRINIKNNLNERFACNVEIDNDLTKENNSIYNGNLTVSEITQGVSYNFFKL